MLLTMVKKTKALFTASAKRSRAGHTRIRA